MSKIPSSVPVFLEQVDDTNQLYTKAKLKAFYVGETADHRVFTKDFSDKVLKTLPLTPVVGFYSEEDEDFKGHHSTQYIYGVVPDNAEISYEEDEESGNTFAVTDVILYTERKDNIGEVASKIVGKQHSLELDPDTLKYKIHRDKKGNFINIEFTDGAFIGLSVLGDNERPAFTGSCFFSENKDFKEISEQCKNNFDRFLNLLNNNGGSIKVFNKEEFLSKVKDKFLACTMQEFQGKICEALSDAGIYGFIMENTEDYAIIDCYDPDTDKFVYRKYTLVQEDDGVKLESPVVMKLIFVTEEEANTIKNNDDMSVNEDAPVDEDVPAPTPVDEDMSANADAAVISEPEVVAPTDTETPTEDANASVMTEGEVTDAKATETNDEQKENEEVVANASATTLSDSEKQELENYRHEEKVKLINDYATDLAQETIDKYMSEVDNYSKDELEAKLAIEFRAIAKTQAAEAKTEEAPVVEFKTITSGEDYNENNIADVVKKYK